MALLLTLPVRLKFNHYPDDIQPSIGYGTRKMRKKGWECDINIKKKLCISTVSSDIKDLHFNKKNLK